MQFLSAKSEHCFGGAIRSGAIGGGANGAPLPAEHADSSSSSSCSLALAKGVVPQGERRPELSSGGRRPSASIVPVGGRYVDAAADGVASLSVLVSPVACG